MTVAIIREQLQVLFALYGISAGSIPTEATIQDWRGSYDLRSTPLRLCLRNHRNALLKSSYQTGKIDGRRLAEVLRATGCNEEAVPGKILFMSFNVRACWPQRGLR
jgi:hypothetical protein